MEVTVTGDYRSTSNSQAPIVDTSNDILQYAGQEVNGVTTIKFERLLITGDSSDANITQKNMNIIFAFQRTKDFVSIANSHDSRDKGTTSLNFLSSKYLN